MVLELDLEVSDVGFRRGLPFDEFADSSSKLSDVGFRLSGSRKNLRELDLLLVVEVVGVSLKVKEKDGRKASKTRLDPNRDERREERREAGRITHERSP